MLLYAFSGESPFFFQQRPGFKGKPFKFIKFKTMNDKRNAMGDLLSDAERMTTIGRVIRRTSLDELPQLFNVLLGQMSFVGPRPLLMEYLPLYSEQQNKRHNVMPGITGWAQVNGRNAISWEKKFQLDLWYVENQSFFLDFIILYKTFKKVLIREGISGIGEATVEKFKGNS